MAALARVMLLAAVCGAGRVLGEEAKDTTCPAQPEPLHQIWYDMEGEIQKTMREGGHYRKGDIIVSVPIKSGTTWTMNIVHQIRSGGDPDMRDIYEQVPWLELWLDPNQPIEGFMKKLGAMPTWFPRAFKTHSAIGMNGMTYDPDLKFVVVMRNPLDAAEALGPFLQQHTEEFVEYWGKTEAFNMLKGITDIEMHWAGNFLQEGNVTIDFIKSFWEHRKKENVLVMHYTDMKKDHATTIRKVAKFLGYDLDDATFKRVIEYTSFPWMKEHGEKFSMQYATSPPLLKPKGMVRKGAVGHGESALSSGTVSAFKEKISKVLTPDQSKWLLEGGPF